MADDGTKPVSSSPLATTLLGLRRGSFSSAGEEDVVLFGVPTDLGAQGRTGSSLAPAAVRRASWTYGSYSQALGLDVEEELSIADAGDVRFGGSDAPEEALRLVQEHVYNLSRGGQIPGMVGGNQTLTLAALRGLNQAKRRPVALLHLTPSHRMRAGEATESGMLRLANQEALVRPQSVLQVGVRNGGAHGDESQEAFRAGFERLSMDDVRWDVHGSMETIRRLVAGSALYVSIDLSVFDPSVCPGVTRPVPGGLSSWEGQQILRALVGADIIGFDVVGYCPPFDLSDLTSVVAVDVLQEVLAALASSRSSARLSVTGGSQGRTSA